MRTRLGKNLAIIRLEHGELLKDMAEKLNYSPPYLSEIEHGKKSIPDNLFDKVTEEYELSVQDQVILKDAIELSESRVYIDTPFYDTDKARLVVEFSRKINDLSKEQVVEILKILQEDDVYGKN